MTTLNRLRSIGISAHVDSGKTTLAERMLYYCGRIHKIRDVRGKDGGATLDSHAIEKRRGITIMSAVTRIAWDSHTFNIIDTPGHVDFTVEVERSLRVLDGAVLVLCSVGGVQSQSLTVDRQMRRHRVPRIAFINKMDRTGANPERVIEQMRDRLKANAVPLQIPIGIEAAFVGVVDLIAMRAVYFDGKHGEKVRRTEIPCECQHDADQARAHLLEALALLDESIMHSLLSGKEPNQVEICRVVRQATLAHRLTPVLLGSAYKNKGVQEVLDAITLYLPSPAERNVFARDSTRKSEDGSMSPVLLSTDIERPLVAMAFKTVIERFGQLTYLRIYQGKINRGQAYQNARTGKSVRFGRLVRIHADQRHEIDTAAAGDIIGIVGIDCASGDTFTAPGSHLSVEPICAAEPVMQLSIAPAKRDDAEKLGKALDRFRREDPTFRVSIDPDTGETLIAGMGQLHLEIYVERIREEHDCPCTVGRPSVAYKERPTAPVDFAYKLKKQTGGPGQYAYIVGRVEPLPVETEECVVFESQIVGGRIEQKFVSAVRRGFVDSLNNGPLGRYDVVGVKMTLHDGVQHEKDSSEVAFRCCAQEAMQKEVLPKADVVLMEPIMKLELEVASEFQGSIAGHLATKRGIVLSSMIEDRTCHMIAEVPLAELFNYANDLRSMTQGSGDFSMEPLGYRQTPPRVQKKVLTDRRNGIR